MMIVDAVTRLLLVRGKWNLRHKTIFQRCRSVGLEGASSVGSLETPVHATSSRSAGCFRIIRPVGRREYRGWSGSRNPEIGGNHAESPSGGSPRSWKTLRNRPDLSGKE